MSATLRTLGRNCAWDSFQAKRPVGRPRRWRRRRHAAFEFEQVVVRIGDLFPAFQIAQLEPLSGLGTSTAAGRAELAVG